MQTTKLLGNWKSSLYRTAGVRRFYVTGGSPENRHQFIEIRAMACRVDPSDEIKTAVAAMVAAPEMLASLRGCRDMLRECAKQLRSMGESGHSAMADVMADSADAAIAKAETDPC